MTAAEDAERRRLYHGETIIPIKTNDELQADRQRVLDAQYKLKEEIIHKYMVSNGGEPNETKGQLWWRDNIINTMAIKLAQYQMTYGEIV